MDGKKIFEIRKASKDLLDWRVRQNTVANVVKFAHKTEGLKHALKKTEICYMLKELGKHFYTEAKWLNGSGFGDVFVLDDCISIEIRDTESKESIAAKAKIYPCRVIDIHVDEKFTEEMLY